MLTEASLPMSSVHGQGSVWWEGMHHMGAAFVGAIKISSPAKRTLGIAVWCFERIPERNSCRDKNH